MSIYSTWIALDSEDHEACARWVRQTGPRDYSQSRIAFNDEGWWLYDPSVTCDCKLPGPLVYLGSHVSPDMSDPRGGSVLVCAIPDHCHPSARGTDKPGERVPFLRLSVTEDPATYNGLVPGGACVVLDEAHVRELRDTLSLWLDMEEIG